MTHIKKDKPIKVCPFFKAIKLCFNHQFLLIDDINTLWWRKFELAATDTRVQLNVAELDRSGLSKTVIQYHHHRLATAKAHR